MVECIFCTSTNTEKNTSKEGLKYKCNSCGKYFNRHVSLGEIILKVILWILVGWILIEAFKITWEALSAGF